MKAKYKLDATKREIAKEALIGCINILVSDRTITKRNGRELLAYIDTLYAAEKIAYLQQQFEESERVVSGLENALCKHSKKYYKMLTAVDKAWEAISSDLFD